jgi:HlyD family secretion protein
MDKPRTDQPHRRLKRWLIASAIALTLATATLSLARLKPAAPTIDRSVVWIDTVKRGPMLRQVRGVGSLVPEDIAWITARTSGRVDRIVLRPGATVKPDDVILVLGNPEVRESVANADSQLKSAQAEVESLRLQLENGALAAEVAAADARANYEQAKLRAEVNEKLFKQGIVSGLELKLSKVTEEQAEVRNSLEQKRSTFTRQSIAPQLAVKHAEVDRLVAQSRTRHDELEALQVRAGMSGVLQVLPVETGAQVTSGSNLARVADPARLKASIRIPETQMKEVRLGQPATIDTRNGIIQGLVARIDPSVRDGTVTVDVALSGELPAGARPDLSIEGTIELERLQNVLFIGRPAVSEGTSQLRLFKLDAGGAEAIRIPVTLGRRSINAVEVLGGLAPGDRVILSDMSRWDGNDRVRLK